MTRQLLTSAILATLALTACGGGSDSSSASSDTTVESASTEAPEVAAPTTEVAVATTEAAPATTEAAPATTEAVVATTEAVPATTEAVASGAKNISTDGPGVCIDAVLAHLGPDAMVNEIRSNFRVGDDIDPPSVASDEPAVPGELFTCSAFYQDPSNPVKLLAIQMDMDTGEFSEPGPVDINFSGDASEFDLNDYVIKASEVNTSVIQPRMDEEAPALDEKYSVWRWDGVSLEAPGPFNDVHVFNLRMEGRLAKNDLNENGYITIAMDGSVVKDLLE